MLELYLDSADIDEISRIAQCLPLYGVTTNPSILAAAQIGIHNLLVGLAPVLVDDSPLFVQVVTTQYEDMLNEVRQLQHLSRHVIVKIPATPTGLRVIKTSKKEGITVLATAIYSAQQGFMAALAGADYLAPYVNRIADLGHDAIAEVALLQQLITTHHLSTKILAASFKNARQALSVMALGIGAITLPPNIAWQLIRHPAVPGAVAQFSADWQATFANKLSFES